MLADLPAAMELVVLQLHCTVVPHLMQHEGHALPVSLYIGVNRQVYDQLKQHVQQLKAEQIELQDARTKQKEVRIAMKVYTAKIML